MSEQQYHTDESQPQRLTNWKNEPTLLSLKCDFDASKPSHDIQVGKINGWNDLLHVRNKAKPKQVKNRSNVQPKLIRRQAEWRYSALTEPFLGTNKLFKCSPSTFEDAKAAQQNELVLNYQFRTHFNRVKFIDDYVRATVDEGTCIVRLGWKRNTVPIKTEVPMYDHSPIDSEEALQVFKQALELSQSNPRMFKEQTTPELKAAIDFYTESGQATFAVPNGQFETVTTQKVLENKPTAEIMNPQNVYIDPSCNGDIDKALFIVVSFETNKAELLKEGKRYKNLDKVEWSSNTPLSQPDHETSTPHDFNLNDATRKKVVAYEYWGFYDIDGNGTLKPIVVTWIGNTIIRMEINPFPDGKLPFVLVPYLPVKREVYGEPDAELLEDNQAILGAVSRGLIDLLGRSANGQQGFAKGMLDPLNRRRYERGEDYEFNPNTNPANGLIEHKYPEIPQSALLMLNLQNQEAEALTGVKSFSGGMSGEAYGDVAAGIRGVLDAASKREMAILRRLAKGMTDIALRIAAMNAVFLSKEETIRITNEEFVVVQREDLKGNFDVEVDISTAEVDNAKSQDLAFMLQTIGNNMDPTFVSMLLAEIATLKRMPELANKLKNWKPAPNPLQELEVQLKQKELEKIDAEIEKLKADAKKASAEADNKNLDFVEQETGTKHARDLEKQAAQARGNQELQVTKALTTPRKEGEKAPDIEAAVGYNEISNRKDDVMPALPVDTPFVNGDQGLPTGLDQPVI